MTDEAQNFAVTWYTIDGRPQHKEFDDLEKATKHAENMGGLGPRVKLWVEVPITKEGTDES